MMRFEREFSLNQAKIQEIDEARVKREAFDGGLVEISLNALESKLENAGCRYEGPGECLRCDFPIEGIRAADHLLTSTVGIGVRNFVKLASLASGRQMFKVNKNGSLVILECVTVTEFAALLAMCLCE